MKTDKIENESMQVAMIKALELDALHWCQLNLVPHLYISCTGQDFSLKTYSRDNKAD